ncbi:di-heme-cytochrome C peroxidase [Aestuariibacter sp. AA17]|uniref:Di-heme-cytochrome C peroxidase n=1 Tax=Fluctibacter corallii TaxID=2984329 RepID=A0ABT3A5N6_9ALTE|nr:di-heme-cytochrome C peroxidase [Aestuariibacter sp. AA17]MCV2883994.1 di-heme-cytochrome C peroxidase [Aestuariibacter sp. AA17]
MGFFRRLIDLMLDILDAVFHVIRRFIRGIFNWVKGLIKALHNLWCALGPKWLRVVFVLLIVFIGGFFFLRGVLAPNITHENIYQVHYLNEGWTDEDRQRYYYTPQGTELLGLQYSWFVNLEQPLSREQLASEENMRGWGFIMSPSQQPTKHNPGNLPVGFTYHYDHQSRLNLDLGCAMCHTGELHYKGTALRVDGGQSMQSVPTLGKGEFIVTLAAAAFETYYNPFKWDRFATRVVGDNNEDERDTLRDEFSGFLTHIKDFVKGPGAHSLYPVTEGRGRTDAVGRIGNVVFGYDIDVPENYKVADAPASYPFLWDIWRFDWVQYTGFTNQAMARNVGESLGVLAPVKLLDENGNIRKPEDIEDEVINLDGMFCVEGVLRKLKPPKWPEDILGKVNIESAKRGKTLFADQCQFCHGPHESNSYQWELATGPDQHPDGQHNVNYQWDLDGVVTDVDGKKVRQDFRERIWSVPWISTDVIGTDSKLADNYMDNLYDASKLTGEDTKVNAGDGLQLLLNVLIPQMYENRNIQAGEEIALYDGLNVPFRIQNHRAYKARPLHGVWATPPFLHNGSVPTIYDLLSPLRARPSTFYVGNREYNPQRLGYITKKTAGAFKTDTTIAGNHNTGHLFTDVDMKGRIGRLLTERERYDLMEYLKVMGNPDFTERLGGDPQNWSLYKEGLPEKMMDDACYNSAPEAYNQYKKNLALVGSGSDR